MKRSGTADLPLHRLAGLRKLSALCRAVERCYEPRAYIDRVIGKERQESFGYGGRTVAGWVQPADSDNSEHPPKQYTLDL